MTAPEESVPSTSETANQQMGAEHGSPAAARSAGATGATTNTPRAQSAAVTSAQGRASPDAIAAAQALMRSSRPSRTSSPMTSRESSPARLPPRAHSAMSGPVRRVARSRKNSIQDQSPHRPPALSGVGSTPSAAAIQRALASASSSAAVADPTKAPRQAQKPTTAATSGDTTPHWPISPRIKSPPPSGSTRSRRNSQRSLSRRPEISSTTSAPNIVLQRAQTPNPPPSTQQQQQQQQQQSRHDSTASDSEDQGGMIMKAPGRAASGTAPMLETVQEGSLPTTPGFDILTLQRTK
ncbi:uncharacterized protein K452DRAFT_6494 [Aplosporella prunicola CBS 121167]|uniref:Uncharacterized protein n=1 Tax=Aplosporella prunicola CBS 121167 TaxID=1176127 RepID=A0A6A6BWU6_9PEZI|nr:uncharacterized protein K452DRAFT_6494 [Aplosporella prunicola CBS 121167]KAF2147377.1 hypothetical protein K452DRAFT_6494 [Aplosporella prunicola CBS 121167]